MKTLVVFLATAVALMAQAAQTAPATQTVPTLSVMPVGTQTAYPGATLSLQVNLSNSSGANLQAIGITGWTGASAAAAGTASTAAAKALWSQGSTYLLVGFPNPPGVTSMPTNTALSDGQLLTFSYLVPPTQAVGSNLTVSVPTTVFAGSVFGSDPTGASIPMAVAPLSLPVVANPTCIATIKTDIGNFLAAPSQVLEAKIETDLTAVIAGGSCQ
jgi:hypothetical protein